MEEVLVEAVEQEEEEEDQVQEQEAMDMGIIPIMPVEVVAEPKPGEMVKTE